MVRRRTWTFAMATYVSSYCFTWRIRKNQDFKLPQDTTLPTKTKLKRKTDLLHHVHRAVDELFYQTSLDSSTHLGITLPSSEQRSRYKICGFLASTGSIPSTAAFSALGEIQNRLGSARWPGTVAKSNIEIHVFTDAYKRVYSASVYIQVLVSKTSCAAFPRSIHKWRCRVSKRIHQDRLGLWHIKWEKSSLFCLLTHGVTFGRAKI